MHSNGRATKLGPIATFANNQDTKAASFVPELIKHALKDYKKLKPVEIDEDGKENTSNSLNPPFEMSFHSVGLFADVSGFTKMTEKLAERGSLGAEILAEKINAYLGQMVRKIQASGGDVVKFAGDALICTWVPPSFEDVEAQKAELKTLSHLAVQVCVKIQKELGEMALGPNLRGGKNKEPNPTLRVKLGVGVGLIRLLIVGGCLGRCEYLISGDGLMQAFSCENDCSPKEVIISPQVHKLVEPYFEFEPCRDSKTGELTGNFRIKKQKKSIVARHARTVQLTSQIVDAFPKFIPSAVKPHLEMPSTFWSGELRDLTILFLSLPFDAKTLRTKSIKIFNKLQDTIKKLQKNSVQISRKSE